MIPYYLKEAIGDAATQRQLLMEARSLNCDFSQLLLSRWNILPLQEARQLKKERTLRIIEDALLAKKHGVSLTPDICRGIVEDSERWNVQPPARELTPAQEIRARIRATKKRDREIERQRAGTTRLIDVSEKDFYAQGKRADGSFGSRQ